jgi:hypothetical protein
MKAFIGWALLILGGIGYFLFHCYTVFVFYLFHGITWAFIAFFIPGFAELVMAGISIASKGLLNQYLLLWLGILTVGGAGKFILAWSDTVAE